LRRTDACETDALVPPATGVEERGRWRRAHARRIAFLVDGDAYFAAFAAAAERAEQSILILGWDVHSGVRLRRDGRRRDLPDRLADFLSALLSRRPALHVNILAWDYATIYALEREPLPLFGRAWRAHPRLHFRLDANHPLGASHHQKVVVMDDGIAFVGGMDLTACRWDTSEHLAEDPRRVDPGFGHYPPFHDVQMVVDGEAAGALGELARDRWRRATGGRIPRPAAGSDPWPPDLVPDVEDVPIGIARTDPPWQGRPAVTEVEALHLEAIARARRSIYLETQYLTAGRLCAALVDRLAEPDGPEVVMVVPRVCSGWLEEATMGVLRARVLRRLHDADPFGRLHVYHPVVPHLADDSQVNVHSKLLVVDDTLLRVGSANSSSRSMRLDTECDLVLDANGSAHVRERIGRFRDRLLAEHLGVPAERVADAVASRSLAAAVDALRGGDRTLVRVEPGAPVWFDDLVPETTIVDPEKPQPHHGPLLELLVGQVAGSARGFIVRTIAVLLSVAALAIAWRWTPLRVWIGWAARSVAPYGTTPAVALLVAGIFVVGELLLVPVGALVAGAALVFGPLLGFAYAFLGSLASAVANYALGRALSRAAVRRFAGRLLRRLSPRLARRSVRAVATGRMVPVAPFALVHLVAGASGVDFRSFALRTLVSVTASTALIVVLTTQIAGAVRHPATGTIIGVVGALVLVLLFGPLARRRYWDPAEWVLRGRDDG
jgi:phosphatidylserine/phosphatidylglycerophosphate/cardiolipin synthase-like enzyme/uncharacterized membrane protein YdjX (TVP38/TMEM64 family)